MDEVQLNTLFHVGERSNISYVPPYSVRRSSWRIIPQGHALTQARYISAIVHHTRHFQVFCFSQGKQTPTVLLHNLVLCGIISHNPPVLLRCAARIQRQVISGLI